MIKVLVDMVDINFKGSCMHLVYIVSGHCYNCICRKEKERLCVWGGGVGEGESCGRVSLSYREHVRKARCNRYMHPWRTEEVYLQWGI